MADRNDRRSRTSRSSAARTTRASRAGRPVQSAGSRSRSRTRDSNRAEAPARSSRPSAPAQAPRASRQDRGSGMRSAPRKQDVRATPGGRYSGQMVRDELQIVSTSVRELRRAERAERLRKASRRHLLKVIVAIGIVVALLAGWAALYNSPAFTIEDVQVNGVEHLTSAEVSQLVSVPAGTTLLRVDTDSIRDRLMQTAWIEDVEVRRAFPSTLEINVTERSVKAVVEIPTSSGSAVKSWAIAEDHMWLMPIPDAGSDAAKATSAQIYADAEAALHIVDVPYGTKAEIGEICTDSNVNNALDIVSGMTTELADHVVKVSAAGPAETTLILDSGVEIAFGKAEDIRDKERVILKIMEENPDGVAYINVRMVETPTWRSV